MRTLIDMILSGKALKGARPHFFQDPDIDRVPSITMALAGELAVARERIDTLERLLDGKGLISRDEIENYRAEGEVAEGRMQAHQAYIARVLRAVQEDIAMLGEPEEQELGGDGV